MSLRAHSLVTSIVDAVITSSLGAFALPSNAPQLKPSPSSELPRTGPMSIPAALIPGVVSGIAGAILLLLVCSVIALLIKRRCRKKVSQSSTSIQSPLYCVDMNSVTLSTKQDYCNSVEKDSEPELPHTYSVLVHSGAHHGTPPQTQDSGDMETIYSNPVQLSHSDPASDHVYSQLHQEERQYAIPFHRYSYVSIIASTSGCNCVNNNVTVWLHKHVDSTMIYYDHTVKNKWL